MHTITLTNKQLNNLKWILELAIVNKVIDFEKDTTKIERERINNNPQSHFHEIHLTEDELTLVEEIERKAYVTVSKSK